MQNQKVTHPYSI